MKTEQGLSSKSALKSLEQFGENKLKSKKKTSGIKIFAAQFKDIMVMILLASTVISVMMGEVTEAVTIIAIVFVNAVLGFVQEFKTEKTLDALKNMAAPMARVMRDEIIVKLPAAEIVPQDVVLIKAGDKVPADGTIISHSNLSCDESLLSGESLAVQKSDNKPVYMGTIVTTGSAVIKITYTGMNTEMGKIASMLSDIEEEPTPLQKKLDSLGKYIGLGCLVICAVVSMTGIVRGEPVFDMLITGISLAVAAVPEGLPAIVTIALALAVSRILKRNALIRRLHAVETLGCANVICSDKTGTLTENKMTAREIFTYDYNAQISGNGFEKGGEITIGTRRAIVPASASLKLLFDIALNCNNSQISSPNDKSLNRDRSINLSKDSWNVIGEPTEIALKIMAAKANFTNNNTAYTRIKEIPFDSTRKIMSVIVSDKNMEKKALVKGGADVVIDRCKYYLTEKGVNVMTPSVLRKINDANNQMAEKALRVLGFAYKLPQENGDWENDLIFVGLVGIIDPPRKEAYEAVAKCKKAKIRTIMITGDQKTTALAIAKDLKIYSHGDMVLTGKELDKMSSEELENAVMQTSVFARVTPAHKLKIVKSLKKTGNIVAMTGDGVNDAPAIKEANIGVAMGISGTDVTKEAAALILLDDNFATLVAAIEEGRVIYSNIRKFIRYLLSCNIGEVVTMFIGMLMGLPVVLLPIQILLVNLATDGLPAIALGLEKAHPEVMSEKPRSSTDSIFSGGLLSIIIFRGALIGITTLAVFVSFIKSTGSIDAARTAALCALVMTQLFHVFECKSETKTIFTINLFDNKSLILAVITSMLMMGFAVYAPFMQNIFCTVSLSLSQIFTILGYSAAVPLLSALAKCLPKKKENVIDESAVVNDMKGLH